jgi:hypothetical protein
VENLLKFLRAKHHADFAPVWREAGSTSCLVLAKSFLTVTLLVFAHT